MNFIQSTIAGIRACNTDPAAYNQRSERMRSTMDRIRVLYLPFFDNGTGLYRCLLPAHEMNQTTTHAAVVAGVEPFSREKQHKGFDVALSEEMIRWAQYIVFPTSFHDLSASMELLRKDNPALRFVMDVDDHYLVPDPLQNEAHADKMRQQLLRNMAACDRVIVSSVFLKEVYHKALEEFVIKHKISACSTMLTSMPNLMSNDCYLNVFRDPAEITDRIRIGMIFNPTQFRDVNPCRKVLLEINKKYGDRVELIVFGWNGKIPKPFKNALDGVKFTHVPAVPLDEYFKTLVNLNLDLALMPLQDNDFNRGKTHHKLLQYSQIGIPVICSDVEPYNQVVSPDINPDGSPGCPGMIPAMLATENSQWMLHIDLLIENSELRKGMGLWANHSVQQYFLWPAYRECFGGLFPEIQ